jgi:hypothetical protein
MHVKCSLGILQTRNLEYPSSFDASSLFRREDTIRK